MLAHELRNPLGTITNAVAVLDKIAGSETSRRLIASSVAKAASSRASWTTCSTWRG